MDTQYTLRARELRDLYTSINLHYLAREERQDVLLTLKHTVQVAIEYEWLKHLVSALLKHTSSLLFPWLVVAFV